MKRRGRKPHPEILTPREQEVLALIDAGCSNDEIASQLGISIDGVKFHVSEILSRLGVPSRQEAAAWYRARPRRSPLLAAPFALVGRLRPSSWLLPASGGIVVVALAAVALLAWAVVAHHADPPPPAQPPSVVVVPQFLAVPNTTSGTGWRIETRVSNLDRLDLVLALETVRAGLRATFVDVPSGRAVAVATFDGSNSFIRLRASPRQLLVSDVVSGRPYQLHIFAIGAADVTLAKNLPLPDRFGYQEFENAMYLSTDGKYAFVPQNSLDDRPECRQQSFDGPSCLSYEVSIIDIDRARVVASVPVGRCLPETIATMSRDHATVLCSRDYATFDDPYGNVVVRVSKSGAGDQSLYSPNDHDHPTAAPYATTLFDGSTRMLAGDGSVWSAPKQRVAASLLRAGYEVIDTRQIDADRVLVLAGKALPTVDVHITEAVVIDLARGRVVSSVAVPAGYIDATVLDSVRGLLLSKDGDRVETQVLDFATGKLAAPVTLAGLPGAPDHIVR